MKRNELKEGNEKLIQFQLSLRRYFDFAHYLHLCLTQNENFQILSFKTQLKIEYFGCIRQQSQISLFRVARPTLKKSSKVESESR